MVFVTICAGSACHIRNSQAVIERLQRAIEQNELQDEVVPLLGFCFGKCSKSGVTIQVDDEIFPGVSADAFEAFFRDHILSKTHQGD